MDGAAGAEASAHRLIGRTAERALLRHLVRDSAQGRLAVVVVGGVAGAGKTALLEWLAGAARDAGADVLWAGGYESSLPLAAVGRLLAPVREVRIGGGPPGELARTIVDALATRSRRHQLLVVIDDVQDLGDASRVVLGDVLIGLDDEDARQRLPIMVALSARTPLAPDGFAERAVRLRAARSVTLSGLDDRETAELLAERGRRAGRADVRDVLEHTGGLPLLIEAGLDDGGTGERVRNIEDALHRRLARVDEPTRAILQRAALLGDPWLPSELAAVEGRSLSDIDAMVDEAGQALLVTRAGAAVRFAHPLVRAELLERLTPAERSAAHVAIAATLESHHRKRGPLPDDVDLRVTDHLLRAAPEPDDQDIGDRALRAGRIAMRWTAYGQATRFLAFAATAAALGERPPDETARRFVEAGHAAYYDYDHDGAESLLSDAITRARRAGDGAVRLRAAMLLVRMRGGRRSSPAADIDVSELRDALAEHPDAPVDVRVQAEAGLAEALIGTGRGEAAEPILASARRTAAGAPPSPSIAEALGRVDFTAGIQEMSALDLDRARDLFDAALAHAREAGSPLTMALACSRRALVGLLRGDVHAAREELEAVEQQTIAGSYWGEAGLAAALLAFVDVMSGSETTVDRIEQAHRHWRRTNNPWNAAILAGLVPLVVVRAMAPGGRPRDPMAPWASRLGLPTPSVYAALAAVEAHDGDAARRVLETASWRQGLRGRLGLDTMAAPVALVEVGDLLDDVAVVRAGGPAVQRMAECDVRLTLPWPASVDRLLAVAARHDGDLDQAGRSLRAALDLTSREALAPERAKCLLEAVRLAAARGDRAVADAAMADAVRAFDEQAMYGWIARCDELGRRLRLRPAIGTAGVIRERTILTNDIVGSTPSNVRLGDVLYLEQLRVHDRILRGRLKEFHGVEIKHTGDGMNAVFDDRADAMRCALAAQRDFGAWNADEPELALRIRCGIAHGPLVPSERDLFGLVQSEAARVCGLAGAGEVLATALVVEDCPPDVTAASLGRRALRGLPDEVEVFRLADGGAEKGDDVTRELW